MLAMPNFADFRMQQQIAHELYRQQIMQRLPDPFATGMLPFSMAPHQHFMAPTQPTLPGVEAKLENNELWKKFHNNGNEMIITKCGRRMFPSMHVSLNGLEEESSYCVLLEMVPIGDCRYKFSGSQWVPAGGAEPQSPQRMYVHPDSPATGAHWQTQPLVFNKVKLTNNTLDNSGQIVLASMHKYQPRLHVVRTADLAQLPWAPQQAFVFPETEFVAVTAYQNDIITKLKIDNNPFAKGFRESGQSRCKRKLADSPDVLSHNNIMENADETNESSSSICTTSPPHHAKRIRTSSANHLDDVTGSNYTNPTEFSILNKNYIGSMEASLRLMPQFYATQTLALPQLIQPMPIATSQQQQQQQLQHHQQQIDYARHIAEVTTGATYPNWSNTTSSSASSTLSSTSSSSSPSLLSASNSTLDECDESQTSLLEQNHDDDDDDCTDDFVDVVSTTPSCTITTMTATSLSSVTVANATATAVTTVAAVTSVPPKLSSFSISDILGKGSNSLASN